MSVEDVLRVLGYLSGMWAVYMTVGSLVFYGWTRRRLGRDPVGWLERRGVDSDGAQEVDVLWLEGQVRFPNYLHIPVVACVLMSDRMVLECQVPTFVRRRRIEILISEVLRELDGRIADPGRHFLVASRPRDVLVSHLVQRGWRVKQVPF